jgi:hypothetical protein
MRMPRIAGYSTVTCESVEHDPALSVRSEDDDCRPRQLVTIIDATAGELRRESDDMARVESGRFRIDLCQQAAISRHVLFTSTSPPSSP